MHANEIWVSVEVYGPQPEIDRLVKLCDIIDADGCSYGCVVDFTELMPGSIFGQAFGTWNGVTRGPHEPCTLDFGFDVPRECPEAVFKALAAEFPSLAFYCSCIADMDEFMAEGWYNGPPGSPAFSYRDVPHDYWETCGRSADPSEEDKAKHQIMVRQLIDAARRVS
jgi:hypothetical protein